MRGSGSDERGAMTAAFDLDHVRDPAWPEALRPVGEATAEKEPFAEWWARNGEYLAHLPSDLCEQWIYRHWLNSPFSFLPLEDLAWERRVWDGAELLRSICRAWGGELHPQFDYETFQRNGGDDRHATAVALDGGTWDYPMVLLATPHGVVNEGETRSDVQLVIVEGHQRHRYLNALHALGRPPAGPHETIVLNSPLIESMPA